MILSDLLIRVFDMYGRMLVQKNSNKANTQLDVSNLVPGIYLVKVINDGKETSVKIVKK